MSGILNGNSSDIIAVKVPKRFQLTVTQAFTILLFIGSTGVTAFWLYSDKHNTDLFVPRTEYAKDQKAVDEKLDKIDRNQEEMQKDIKKLLERK